MRKTLPSLFVLMILPLVAQADDFASRPEALEFVREFAGESDFAEGELLSILGRAAYQQSVIDAISRPAETQLVWAEYQDIFLTEERTSSGIGFMAENREALDEAHRVHGVPPEIVTAIIGVETMYGRISGSYRVLDALATLTFDYPPRADFFRGQLKQFIRLVDQEGGEITGYLGSYAGAMGLGQFIPSSYLNYAVDFDGDGYRDIWNNPADAIGSVANYLREHGWRRDAGIALRIGGDGLPREVFSEALEPNRSLAELEALGMDEALGNLDRNQQVTPLRFAGKRGDEFWLGLENFYVITRYNHSKLYAMAVYQLSEDLRRQ